MDKTTKSIFAILSVFIIVAIALMYYRTIVRKDYVVFPDEMAEEGIPFEAVSETDLGFSKEVQVKKEGEDGDTTP